MKTRMKAQMLEVARQSNVLSDMSLLVAQAYSNITLKRMIQWKWKMLAMPRAKARMMHSTPVLQKTLSAMHSLSIYCDVKQCLILFS